MMIDRLRHPLRTAATDETPHETADDGFTLIELLVVITILGILAAITVFSVQGIGDKGQAAACKTDTATLRTAQEAYFVKNNAYAGNVAALVTAGYLATPSSLHTVAISGTTYTISTAAGATGAVCGGTGGQAVDGTTIF